LHGWLLKRAGKVFKKDIVRKIFLILSLPAGRMAAYKKYLDQGKTGRLPQTVKGSIL